MTEMTDLGKRAALLPEPLVLLLRFVVGPNQTVGEHDQHQIMSGHVL